MAPKSQQAARGRKKVKKVVTEGIAHVHASFNNTIITLSLIHISEPTRPY